jgi:hypothetical protein
MSREKYIPIVPAKPANMTQADWDLETSSPHCVRLARGECRTPCSLVAGTNEYVVESDHVEARSNGGHDRSGNRQWLCKNANRQKGIKMDARYGDASYYDQTVNVHRLRDNQLEHAYEKIMQFRALFESATADIFSVFLLLAWIVGGGKTVGAASLLFAVNRVLNDGGQGRRRVKQALFLVHHRKIVQQIAQELEKELVGYGIVGRKPRVLQINEPGDWARAKASEHDAVVACVQSIWLDDNSNECSGFEQMKMRLSIFEAVVVDECHFGVERWMTLAEMMPKAWKFVMTSTPMRGDEMLSDVTDEKNRRWVRERMILFSTFTYQDADDLGYMKALPTSVEDGLADGSFVQVNGGEKVVLVNGSETAGGNEHDKIKDNLIIQTATLLRLAEIVQEDSAEYGYPVHAIIRVAGILSSGCDHLSQYINSGAISGWPREKSYRCAVHRSGSHPQPAVTSDGEIVEHGTVNEWLACKVEHEKALKLGKPFVLPETATRFMACLNLGQIGLNNWMCNAVCFFEGALTVCDIVQRIGRAVRCNRVGAKARVRVVWPSNIAQEFVPKLERAMVYIMNMEDELKNFLKIEDWVECSTSVIESPASKPVLNNEQRKFAEAVAADWYSSDKSVDAREFAEARINLSDKLWDGNARLADRAASMAEQLATDEAYRRSFLGVPAPLCRPDTSIVVKDSPPEEFSEAELVAEVRKGTLSGLGVSTQDLIDRISRNDLVVIGIVKASLLKRLHESYAPPRVTVPLVARSVDGEKRKGATGTIAAELLTLVPRGMLSGPSAIGAAMKAVNTAVAWYFRLPNLQLASYELHEVHYVAALMRFEHRRPVMGFARSLLLAWHGDRVPNHAALHASTIDEVIQALEGQG